MSATFLVTEHQFSVSNPDALAGAAQILLLDDAPVARRRSAFGFQKLRSAAAGLTALRSSASGLQKRRVSNPSLED